MEPKTEGGVEERLARVEQKLHDLKTYIMSDTKSDIEKLEEKFEAKVIEMEKRCAIQFRWTVGIYLTTFSAIIALILGLCVR